MDDVYVYLADLPDGIHEMICPCADGHTIYIDASLTREQACKAYNHAIQHIMEKDFDKDDVQQIESEVRKK